MKISTPETLMNTAITDTPRTSITEEIFLQISNSMSEFSPSELDVWVLAGQSNMQGCGLLQGVTTPDERVWCFTSAGRWEVANEPLHRLWKSYTPSHGNVARPHLIEELRDLPDEELALLETNDRTHGAGLGIAFGKAMADSTGQKSV